MLEKKREKMWRGREEEEEEVEEAVEEAEEVNFYKISPQLR